MAESGHPSRLVTRLEGMGLVRREASPYDGRASLLSLTEEGAAKAAAARAARAPLARANWAERNADLAELTETLRRQQYDN